MQYAAWHLGEPGKRIVVSELEHPAGNGTNLREQNLQRASDFYAVLLAMAGHDLRQPLQVIMSAYSWLARRHPEGREREYVERGQLAIAQMTDQLDHLVDALHLHERSSRIELVPVSLEPLLSDLCRDNNGLARQRRLRIRHCFTRIAVLSDKVLLDSILRNLICNALKYTPAGGKILIGCRRRGSIVRIEVHDTGVGIPPNYLSKIFDAFQRLDSPQSNGLGLGLFVVRRAVDLLGHRIEVRSMVGRGSCFSVLANVPSQSVLSA
jgi:signal transduction histidine kinase